MATLTIQKKRKNIDIPTDIFRSLSIKAAADGKSLKTYIEHLLVLEADAISDEELYKYLTEKKPEGDIYLDESEQKEFENWLDI